MASIVTKKLKSGATKFYVIYRLPAENGKRKQTWIPFESRSEAKLWFEDIQAAERAGEVFIRPYPNHSTFSSVDPYTSTHRVISVQQLLEEFVCYQCQGENPAWSASTLISSESIIRNYILPYIGQLNIAQITPVIIQAYYDDLPNRKAVQGYLQHREPKNISARNVRDIHKILHPAFKLAIRRGYLQYNPTDSAKLPRQNKHERQILSTEDLQKLISHCKDPLLRLCICLMLGCTLRDSELSGLTWDCVDISSESLSANKPSLLIEKTLRRLDKAALGRVSNRDVIRILPPIKAGSKSIRVLKSTKTEKSYRRVYLPNYVAELLIEHRTEQNRQKKLLGADYLDYGFVIAQPDGNPYLCQTFSGKFKKLLKELGLPHVDFYSLRHASATIKMSATKDIKAVQGDLGHASSNMSVKIYMKVVDEARQANAVALDNSLFHILETTDSSP